MCATSESLSLEKKLLELSILYRILIENAGKGNPTEVQYFLSLVSPFNPTVSSSYKGLLCSSNIHEIFQSQLKKMSDTTFGRFLKKAIFAAAKGGSLAVLKCLLAVPGVEEGKLFRWTIKPIEIAIKHRNFEVAIHLLTLENVIEAVRNDKNKILLYQALKCDYIPLISSLIEILPLTTAQEILLLAAELKKFDLIVKILQAHPVKIKISVQLGMPILEMAAAEGHSNVIRCILERLTSYYRDKFEATIRSFLQHEPNPFWIPAIESNNAEVISVIIEHQSICNLMADGRHVQHIEHAVGRSNNVLVTKLLFEKNILGSYYNTIMMVIQNNNMTQLNYLLGPNFNPMAFDTSLLERACESNGFHVMNRLLEIPEVCKAVSEGHHHKHAALAATIKRFHFNDQSRDDSFDRDAGYDERNIHLMKIFRLLQVYRSLDIVFPTELITSDYTMEKTVFSVNLEKFYPRVFKIIIETYQALTSYIKKNSIKKEEESDKILDIVLQYDNSPLATLAKPLVPVYQNIVDHLKEKHIAAIVFQYDASTPFPMSLNKSNEPVVEEAINPVIDIKYLPPNNPW